MLLTVSLVAAMAVQAVAGETTPAEWLQWGGPNRDFKAPSSGLATSWPESGPETLWSRELGEGYSAILVEADRLYTQYRAGGKEAVVCLDAATGETIWEYLYEHGPHEKHLSGYGDGPRSTPIIAGDLLFTVGVAGMMHALNKKDGKVVWTHDLWKGEFSGNFHAHGYSSSPVVHKEMVIVPVGGKNASLVAFDQKSGRVIWKALSFLNSHSSPRIMEIAGEEQLVVFMAEELIGVDPDTGELRWRYEHANQWRHNINMPVAVDGEALFLSSPQAGARGLRLARESSVRNGDWVYGSTGAMSPAFMAAVNIRTGEIGWRERGFAKANCVEADGKLIILDEDGMLYLATATPEKLTVHAKTQLLDGVAWTVPTIVGQTMYVRDNKRILAVNLG
jgi:outer membrane protein assembly factor BamB